MKKAFLIFFLLILSPGLVYGQNAEIHKAAYNGDIQRVQELLSKGVNPDARDSYGGTALHAAMFQKNMVLCLGRTTPRTRNLGTSDEIWLRKGA